MRDRQREETFFDVKFYPYSTPGFDPVFAATSSRGDVSYPTRRILEIQLAECDRLWFAVAVTIETKFSKFSDCSMIKYAYFRSDES